MAKQVSSLRCDFISDVMTCQVACLCSLPTALKSPKARILPLTKALLFFCIPYKDYDDDHGPFSVEIEIASTVEGIPTVQTHVT